MAYHPFRHLGLKVVAITLATVLWLTVAGEHVVERSLRVPLAVRNLATSLEIVGDLPAAVDVRVRGSSTQLSRLDPGEVVAMLDLATARTGERLFHLRTDEVKVPYGIEVAQVMPPSLSLSIERSAKRSVPIVPATDGEPAAGFVVGRISAEPSTVEIMGPESHVREVSEATTEPIEIDGKNSRVREVVAVGVTDSSVRLAEPQNVTVVVEISPAPVERDVSGVPVRSKNLGQALTGRIVPETVRVRVRGQRDALAAIRPDSIEAFVDLTGLGPGKYRSSRSGRSIRGIRRRHRDAKRCGHHHQMTNPRPLFGTDGVRGHAGEYPLDRRPSRVWALRSSARCLRRQDRTAAEPVVTVCDSLSAVIPANPASGSSRSSPAARDRRVRRSPTAGVIPTPAIAYVTPAMGFDAGIVISASHNPFQDNGIKVFSGRGEKFTEALERQVEAIVAGGGWSVPDSATRGWIARTSSTSTCRTRGSRCRTAATCAA